MVVVQSCVRLDAAFFNATCRVVPKRRHVCALHIKSPFVWRICDILNAGWHESRGRECSCHRFSQHFHHVL